MKLEIKNFLAPDESTDRDGGRLDLLTAGDVIVGPGDLCAVPPGHDFRVLGDEPYTSLHFHGAEEYGEGNA